MYRLFLAAIAVLLMIIALPGCSHKEFTSTISAPAYTDNVTENLIRAFSDNDYLAYFINFDENATLMVAQDWFSQQATLMQNKLGAYVQNSKVMTDVKLDKQFVQVTYSAKFMQEDNVYVIIDLETSGNMTYAAGIWFNSPKLFEP